MKKNSPLKIRYRNLKIALAGPQGKEREVRIKLKEQLFDILSKCAYFHRSQLAADASEEIADMVRYQAWKDPRKKTEVAFIKSLDVIYKNTKNWRWWARIRDNQQTANMGSDATGS